MNAFENLQLKWKIILGFAIPLVLITVISSVVYVDVGKLIHASDRVSHTHEAIELGGDITGSLVNMETGFRGFLIAGRDEFLGPYTSGKSDFINLMATVKEKVIVVASKLLNFNK